MTTAIDTIVDTRPAEPADFDANDHFRHPIRQDITWCGLKYTHFRALGKPDFYTEQVRCQLCMTLLATEGRARWWKLNQTVGWKSNVARPR